MKTFIQQQRSSSRLWRYLPWIVIYLSIIGGTTAFAAEMYKKYDTRHLPSGYIELVVDKEVYQLGEVVEFTVINHFPVPVYVLNQCPEEPLNVYRWENNVWVPLHATAVSDGECYSQERNVGVSSDDSRSYNFADWPELFATPGVYRIAANIDHYSDVPFQDFVVLAPPEVIEVLDPPEIRYVNEASKPVLPTIVPVPEPEPEPIVEVPVKEVEVYVEREREEDDDEDEEDEEDDD